MKKFAIKEKITSFVGNKKITGIYAMVFILVIVIFILSFAVTNHISRNAVKDEMNSAPDLSFTSDNIMSYISNIQIISETLMSDPTLNRFMRSPTVYDRIVINNDLSQILKNLHTICRDISMIAIYNSENTLIKNSGDFFVHNTTKIDKYNQITYANKQVSVGNKEYYSLIIPIYNLSNKQSYDYLGYCNILVDFQEITNVLSASLPSQNSIMCIKNQSEEIIVQSASDYIVDWTMVNNPQLYTYDEKTILPDSGWKLVRVVEKNNIPQSINLMQRINIFTYSLVVFIFASMFAILYFTIIRPIKGQVLFMQKHQENPTKRMKVKYNNELSQISANMNVMLDNIDKLSQENYKSQKKYYDSEIVRQKTEILAYRNQINPHFLYNTFECIRGMALDAEIPEIANITEALSNLYRYNVKGDGYASVEEEVKYAKEYAKIIDYRFMGKFRIHFECEPQLNKFTLPKMCIQPLIENSVFHGLENKLGAGSVQVSLVALNESTMRIEVKDDGVGMSPQELSEIRKNLKKIENKQKGDSNINGIGMENICRRLNLFYGKKIPIIIESELGKGTVITLELHDTVQIDAAMNFEEYIRKNGSI